MTRDISEGGRITEKVQSRVMQTMAEHGMAERGGHIIAALSGGADRKSVV